MTSNKNLTLLTLALAAILVLFGINLISHLGNSEPAAKEGSAKSLLSVNNEEVKGLSIERDGKTYTLNLKQQTAAIAFINRMRPVDKKRLHQTR